LLARPFVPLPLLLSLGFAAVAATAWLKPGDLTALVRPWRDYFAEQQRVDPKAVAHVDSGNALLNQGEYDDAIAEYTQALAIDPNYAAAHEGRGNVYFQQGYYDLAIAEYDAIILLRPKYVEAYFRRAVAYYNKGDYERAIAGYNDVIRLNPRFVLAYTNRTLAYQNRNNSTAPSPLAFGQSNSSLVMRTPTTTAPPHVMGRATTNESGPTTVRQSGWIRSNPWPSPSVASPPRTRTTAAVAPSRPTVVRQSGWIRK
jgi:tetratricopeptide (TPR) repeat protein